MNTIFVRLMAVGFAAFVTALAASPTAAQKWALRFDGIDDYALNAAVPAQRAHTYEAWVRLPRAGVEGVDPIRSWVKASNARFAYTARCSSGGGNTRLAYSLDPAGCGNDGAVHADVGSCWMHVAGVHDGSRQQDLYFNGILVGSRVANFGRAWSSFAIGSLRDQNCRYANVEIAEARFWDHARSAAQIRANLTPGSIKGTEPGLVALYLMNEGGGQVLNDSSPNGYHMQLGTSAGPDAADPTWFQASVVVPATEVVRAGSPANPVALRPGVTSRPVIGATWDPVVDHTNFAPAALFDVLVVGLPTNVPSSVGTFLTTLPPNALVFSAPPGRPFAVPVPGLCAFLGAAVTAQAGSVSPGGKLELTNALDIVLGNL